MTAENATLTDGEPAEVDRLAERYASLDLQRAVYTTAIAVQLLRQHINEAFGVRGPVVNTMRAAHCGFTELMTRLCPDEFAQAIEEIYGDDDEEG